MKNFQRKKGWKNIVQSRPVLVFLGILMFVSAFGMIGFMGKMKLTVDNKKLAENKVVELEKEKEKLSSDIAKLKSPDGMEENIRQKFGLVKKGEGMIVVVEDKNPPEPLKQESSGFFSFLKNLFK